jgi:ComF family protein
MLNKFLNLLFPETCPICQNPCLNHETAPICVDCWQSIRKYNGPLCKKCGTPLVSDVSIKCGECLKEEPAFEFARSFGLYDNPLRKGINLLKYHGKKRLSRPLSELLIKAGLPEADIVLPVPLHHRRLRKREFNQSALISKYIAEEIKSKFIPDCLVKVRDTLPQVGLRYKARVKNIKGAFKVRNSDLIKNRKIILVDDVVTTGATIRECSRTLKKAGAGKIYVVSLAHGMSD